MSKVSAQRRKGKNKTILVYFLLVDKTQSMMTVTFYYGHAAGFVYNSPYHC